MTNATDPNVATAPAPLPVAPAPVDDNDPVAKLEKQLAELQAAIASAKADKALAGVIDELVADEQAFYASFFDTISFDADITLKRAITIHRDESGTISATVAKIEEPKRTATRTSSGTRAPRGSNPDLIAFNSQIVSGFNGDYKLRDGTISRSASAALDSAMGKAKAAGGSSAPMAIVRFAQNGELKRDSGVFASINGEMVDLATAALAKFPKKESAPTTPATVS